MFPDIIRDDVFRLESRRLWLRWPELGDAAALTAIAGQPAVAEMTISVPYPYPKGEACRQIEQWREANAAGDALTLVMTGQGNDRTPFGVIGIEPAVPQLLAPSVPLVAGAGPVVTITATVAKLGFLLAPDQWGVGLATEAVQAIVDAVFVLNAASRIESAIRVVNPAARRVVERCGFAYEATVLRSAPARGGMVPCDCFRLDAKTWASLKQWRMPIGQPPFASAGGRAVVVGLPRLPTER